MQTNNLVIDDRSHRQTIEGVVESFPHFDAESLAALVVKAVDAVDSRTLVVAPQQEKVFGVLDLVGKEQAGDFDGLLSAVHVVAQKEIVGLLVVSARVR